MREEQGMDSSQTQAFQCQHPAMNSLPTSDETFSSQPWHYHLSWEVSSLGSTSPHS